MKLNLNPCTIRLPGGIVATARPLETWAYQRWLDFALRHLGGAEAAPHGAEQPRAPQPGGQDAAMPVTDRTEAGLRRALTDPEALRLAEAILPAHVLSLGGLEVDTPQGCRPGTVQDLLSQGALLHHVLLLMAGLMRASTLTEADLGNSAAPPPAPSAG